MHFYTKFKCNGLKKKGAIITKHIFMQWNKPSCSRLKSILHSYCDGLWNSKICAH